MFMLMMKEVHVPETNNFSFENKLSPAELPGFFSFFRDKNSIFLSSGNKRDGFSFLGFEVKRKLVFELNKNEPAQNSLNKIYDFWLENKNTMPWGMFGYLSYDFGLKLAEIESRQQQNYFLPDFYFVIPEKVAIYDHEQKLIRANFDFSAYFKNISLAATDFNFEVKNLKPETTFKSYAEKIAEIKEYLYRGETYQVNFSQRFKAEYKGDPWRAFLNFAGINPSPYQVFFDFEGITLASNSPERLVCGYKKGEEFVLESRPIKGTIGRGKNETEDLAKKEELLASEKNLSELTMIVDLIRNDLASVSEIASVEVDEDRIIETYSHLHHTMSNVKSVLKKGLDFRDVLKALFPGGSITGCPKYRTMQIIDKLEEVSRGLYCGSAGYIDKWGNFDFNILIRSLAFVQEKKAFNDLTKAEKNLAGVLYFNSGGGIVYDSDAEQEYDESLRKAEALIKALG